MTQEIPKPNRIELMTEATNDLYRYLTTPLRTTPDIFKEIETAECREQAIQKTVKRLVALSDTTQEEMDQQAEKDWEDLLKHEDPIDHEYRRRNSGVIKAKLQHKDIVVEYHPGKGMVVIDGKEYLPGDYLEDDTGVTLLYLTDATTDRLDALAEEHGPVFGPVMGCNAYLIEQQGIDDVVAEWNRSCQEEYAEKMEQIRKRDRELRGDA